MKTFEMYFKEQFGGQEPDFSQKWVNDVHDNYVKAHQNLSTSEKEVWQMRKEDNWR